MSHSSSPNVTDKVFATVVLDPCEKTHMGCLWYPFGSLWATNNGYMVLSVRKPVFSEGCEHQRRRPTCTSALSDQHLCCSLFVKYHSFGYR